MDLESDRFFLCRSCCKFFKGTDVFLEHKKVCSKNLGGQNRNSAQACDELLRASNLSGKDKIKEADSFKTSRRAETFEITENELESSGNVENVEQQPAMEIDGTDNKEELFVKDDVKCVRTVDPVLYAALHQMDSATETKVAVEVKIEESVATVSERSLDDVTPEGATLSVRSSASVISDNDSDSGSEASFTGSGSESESDSRDSFQPVKQRKNPPNESKECKICDKKFSRVQTKKSHDIRMHAETLEFKEALKQHQCDICKKKFFQQQELTIHIRTHTGEKPYACRFCPKKFVSSESRKLHEKCMHGIDPTFRESFKQVCAICSKKFMNSYLLDLHMRSHTGRKPFSCDFCPKTFSQRAHKKAHALCMHPDEEHVDENGQKLHFHQCSQCPKKFYSKPDLKRHELVHSGEMPFKCRFCPVKFNLAGNQNRHEIDVHHDKLDPEKMAGKHKCGWCSRIFHSKSELRGHETTHSGSRDFKCNHCSRSYTSKNSLNLHLRINHQDLTHLKLTPLPPSRLKGKKGNGTACPPYEDDDQSENLSTSDAKYYKCSTCSKEFNSKSILERHELRGHSDKTMFPCRFCSREFTGNQGRFYHELCSHQEEMDPQEIAYKPKCRWCDKRFVNQAYLTRHEKTHSKIISGKGKRLAPRSS